MVTYVSSLGSVNFKQPLQNGPAIVCVNLGSTIAIGSSIVVVMEHETRWLSRLTWMIIYGTPHVINVPVFLPLLLQQMLWNDGLGMRLCI